MSDLERLWDDYPTGKAPTADILRAGRRGARTTNSTRRRSWTRPVLSAGVVTGVVGAFIAGAVVGGNGGGPGLGPGGALPSHVAFQADLPAAENCEELLDTYIERGLRLVGPYGWDGPRLPYSQPTDGVFPRDRAIDDFSELSDSLAVNTQRSSAWAPTNGYRAQASKKIQRQVNSETGTNVQEAFVDEPDVVKTNGALLARVSDDKLIGYDVSGADVERLASLRLPGMEDAELLLAGDTVVAIGTDETAKNSRGTRVLQISLADADDPEIVADVSYDAVVLSARQHGDVVRLVMSSGLPDLDFVEPGKKRSHDKAEEQNREVVRETTIEDWLPEITTDAGSGQLLDCTDVAIPDDELSLDTVSVVGFTADDPATVRAIGLAGGTDIAYESRDHLYLAASPAQGWGWGMCRCIVDPGPSVKGGTSYLFDFALDGVNATHVASGEVEGAIADRWSMDEYDDVLRVAVGPTSETGNFNSVVTFSREGEELLEIGRLDEIGPNEDIKAVRWMDELAVVVTFRRVDPLYVVDLADDADPTLLSELKIPGFSSYLHPLGTKRMVGVGEGPTGNGWGAQVGLFDVTDLTDVTRLDVQSYRRGTDAIAGGDPRAFTWLPGERTVLTVIAGREAGARTGWVSVLKLHGGELHNRMVQVEYGRDVEQVRTVPLPDGRVVLVTGEDAEFFSLDAP